MSNQVNHSSIVSADEELQTQVAGQQPVDVKHSISYTQRNDQFENIWSRRFDLLAAQPLVLDLTSLTYAVATTIKDLLTGQELRLIRIRNTGSAANAVFSAGQDNLLVAPLKDGSELHLYVPAGHVLLQPIDTITLTALTGDCTMAIFLGTKLP